MQIERQLSTVGVMHFAQQAFAAAAQCVSTLSHLHVSVKRAALSQQATSFKHCMAERERESKKEREQEREKERKKEREEKERDRKEKEWGGGGRKRVTKR